MNLPRKVSFRGVLKIIRKNAQRVYEQQRTEKFVKNSKGQPVSPEWLRNKTVHESLAVLGLWADYYDLNAVLTMKMTAGLFHKVAKGKHLRRLGKAAQKKGLFAPLLQIEKCAKGMYPFLDGDMRKIKFVTSSGKLPSTSGVRAE